MKPIPCKKDCPKRSSTCHGICAEYKRWRQELDKTNEKKKLEGVGYPRSYGKWIKTNDGHWRNKEIKRRR